MDIIQKINLMKEIEEISQELESISKENRKLNNESIVVKINFLRYRVLVAYLKIKWE